jgi:hypothetical protein
MKKCYTLKNFRTNEVMFRNRQSTRSMKDKCSSKTFKVELARKQPSTDLMLLRELWLTYLSLSGCVYATVSLLGNCVCPTSGSVQHFFLYQVWF